MFWLVAGTIFTCGLTVRLAVLLILAPSPFFNNPIIDAEYHDAWARVLATDRPDAVQRQFLEQAYFKPPLYPLLLGGWYAAFGRTLWHVKVAQAVLGAAGCVLVLVITRRLFGFATAVIAAGAAVLYRPWIFFDAWLLNTELAVFLYLAAATALIGLPARPRRWLAAVGGALTGLAAIAWPAALLLIPALGAWVWRTWPAARTRARAAATFLIAAALPVAAVAARNLVIGDDLVLISANAGINFYTGNRPGADGVSAVPTGLKWERLNREARRAGVTKASAASRYWFRRGWQAVLAAPGRTAGLVAKKAAVFFNAAEPRNNIAQDYFCARHWPLRGLLGFGIVGPVALAGLWAGLRRADRRGAHDGARAGAVLCLIFAGAALVSVLPFFVADRYRLLAVPLLLPFAGLACVRLWNAGRHRHWKAVSAYAAALAGLAVVVNVDWFNVRPRHFGPEHFHLGRIAQRRGDMASASLEFARSLDLSPTADAWVCQSATLRWRRLHPAAADAARACLLLAPDAPEGHYNLGAALLGMNRPAEALDPLTRAIELAPDNVLFVLDRARALLDLGRKDDARKDLRRASQLPMTAPLVRQYRVLLRRCRPPRL